MAESSRGKLVLFFFFFYFKTASVTQRHARTLQHIQNLQMTGRASASQRFARFVFMCTYTVFIYLYIYLCVSASVLSLVCGDLGNSRVHGSG